MSDQKRAPGGIGKEAEADDPLELVPHTVPGGDPALMATCLVEEYARMGWEQEKLLELFLQPHYQLHALYLQRGEGWVRQLIARVLERSGQMRIVWRETPHPPDPLVLLQGAEPREESAPQPHFAGGDDV